LKYKLPHITKKRRVLVSAHDAFAYFGRAYDIEVRSLQGISTADEADLGSVNRLVDLLAARKIKAVFVESSVPPRNVQALVQGCAARGHPVKLGGELYSDALGPPNTPEATYVGVVRYNVKTIVEALR
jgi:manganese/zinc/iron transport system substrate-binding protein